MTIPELVEDLAGKQALLSEMIEERLAETGAAGSPESLARLFSIHGQNAARLGRLLRDLQALSPESGDALSELIAEVLEALGREKGVEL